MKLGEKNKRIYKNDVMTCMIYMLMQWKKKILNDLNVTILRMVIWVDTYTFTSSYLMYGVCRPIHAYFIRLDSKFN